MSVAQPQTPLTKPSADNRQITIVSHSTLFYWWPVWAIGFVLGLLSLFWGGRMVFVPSDTMIVRDAEVIGPSKAGEVTTYKNRDVLLLPEKGKFAEDPLKLHIAKSKNYGVLFATVLLLVVVITNVPLRGMWSFVVIGLVVLLSIVFAWLDLWEKILLHISYLDIRINAGGYFFISFILLIIWLFTVLVFDKQVYMVFTPGQFKVCTEVGGGEQTYSTIGMTLEKQRSDLFRHWILGLGSGDLIVKTTGAQAHHFEMSNVLFVSRKMQQIEDMVRKIPD
ncbi:MAG TPA: hypothetical protein VMF69_03190 [Gemmataceae bacterium]|nr:hypothetical protein [Gemmataceae bacterium]